MTKSYQVAYKGDCAYLSTHKTLEAATAAARRAYRAESGMQTVIVLHYIKEWPQYRSETVLSLEAR